MDLFDLLREAQKKYPHLRVGQLICNCSGMPGGDPFYLKDENLKKNLELVISGADFPKFTSRNE